MITSLILKNYKGFSEATIHFSNITCIIGENGTGKSTIIQAIQNSLSSPNSKISPDLCKVGINDNSKTSLSLVFSDGRRLSKSINSFEYDNAELPAYITTIDLISAPYSFGNESEQDYDKPIKDCEIGHKGWKNLLNQCDFTLRTAIQSTVSEGNFYSFEDNYTRTISAKFTNIFNNMFRGVIKGRYEFRLLFYSQENNLRVKLLSRYEEDNRTSDKLSPWLDWTYESSGLWILISLCSYFFNEQDTSQKPLFIMDEPFTNIHPKAQREVSRILESLSQRFQVIYSTHSPHLLPKRDKVICTLSHSGGDLSVCNYEEYTWKDFYDLSPLDLDYIQEIEKSHAAINVCVEGPTDQIIYQKFFDTKGISDSINIMDLGGKKEFPKYMRVFGTINKPSLFILDPDGVKRKQGEMDRLVEAHSNIILLELKKNENNHIGKGIENLIPNQMIEKASEKENQGVQLLTRRICLGREIQEYKVVGKKQLADFFVNEAGSDDWKFFDPVINEIDKICEDFEIELS